MALPRWGWTAADACGAEPVKAAIISADATRTALSILMPLTVSLARSVPLTRQKLRSVVCHKSFFCAQTVISMTSAMARTLQSTAGVGGQSACRRSAAWQVTPRRKGAPLYCRAVAPSSPLFATAARLSPAEVGAACAGPRLGGWSSWGPAGWGIGWCQRFVIWRCRASRPPSADCYSERMPRCTVSSCV